METQRILQEDRDTTLEKALGIAQSQQVDDFGEEYAQTSVD